MTDDRIEKFNSLPGMHDIYFVMIALLLAFGFLQTSGTLLDTERPAVSVISPSMCPAIQVGDILVVKGADYEDIQIDDVIIYDVPDRAEIQLGGEKIVLEGEGDTEETPQGTLELIDVIPSRDRSMDQVVLELNGEKLKPDGNYPVEGRQYSSSTYNIGINYVTSLPYDNTPIVHRVVEKHDNSFETMGDANTGQIEFERNVTADQVYGKQVFKIPRLGLLKLVTMDLLGLQGDQPLVLDATPSC